jgi:hypothetical protein
VRVHAARRGERRLRGHASKTCQAADRACPARTPDARTIKTTLAAGTLCPPAVVGMLCTAACDWG